MAGRQRFFALTICGYRKPGMGEDEYHEYVSEKHAQCLKDLMVKNKIVSYTMVRIFLVINFFRAGIVLTLRSNITQVKQRK